MPPRRRYRIRPGRVNPFVIVGASAEIHADFDRNGVLALSAAERALRFRHPGAIVLPNINLSAGLPPGVPNVDLSDERDCDDDRIQGAADLNDLTEFRVRSPGAGVLLADTLTLHLRDEDLERCRVFLHGPGAPETWDASLGCDATNDYALAFPAAPWELTFHMEALTLAGCPTAPGPTGATPDRPLPPPAAYGDDGRGVTRASSGPVYPETAPGEIWLQLVHERGGETLANNFDTTVFLIAPFLLQSNLEPCERIYAVYAKCGAADALNHEFVYDLMGACWQAFGVAGNFDRDSHRRLPTSLPRWLANADTRRARRCRLSPGKLYLIDGDAYRGAGYPDPWIQDQFEMGYCSAPGGRALNMVIHCKRDMPLGDFVQQELAHTDVGLYNDLAGVQQDSTDFGGNIEVSSPVLEETKAQSSGDAGPAILAHPRAPFGKIILGDCRNANRPAGGRVHDDTRTLLASQVVQPIVPINTSWLMVAHADEIMSFIPANTPRGSALVLASVRTMDLLLKETAKVTVADGRTNLLRGKFWNHPTMIYDGTAGNPIAADDYRSYAEISVEDLLASGHQKYSQTVRKKFMLPIRQRLMKCTAHGRGDVIPVPVYFKRPVNPKRKHGHPDNQAVAYTVDMVNMQVVNRHLMVPRPFGPRVPRDRAVAIVRSVLKRDIPIRTPPDDGFTFWAWPGLSAERVAQFFAHPDTSAQRAEIIAKIKDPAAALGAGLNDLIRMKWLAIRAENPSHNLPLDPAGRHFGRWQRLVIPENTVDVLETYMLTVLGNLGNTVHFIDDWFYHTQEGEVHCGTNAKRTPPAEAALAEKWWEVYDPSIDTSYDPGS